MCLLQCSFNCIFFLCNQIMGLKNHPAAEKILKYNTIPNIQSEILQCEVN